VDDSKAGTARQKFTATVFPDIFVQQDQFRLKRIQTRVTQ
jgi:hypothetical protein